MKAYFLYSNIKQDDIKFTNFREGTVNGLLNGKKTLLLEHESGVSIQEGATSVVRRKYCTNITERNWLEY
jgi:hypothetical protein